MKRKSHGRYKRFKLLERQGFVCFYCRKLLRPHSAAVLEHMIPLSRGGTEDLYNLCIACERCDHEKGAMTADEFLRSKGWERMTISVLTKRSILYLYRAKERKRVPKKFKNKLTKPYVPYELARYYEHLRIAGMRAWYD